MKLSSQIELQILQASLSWHKLKTYITMRLNSFIVGIFALLSGVVNLYLTWGQFMDGYIEPQPVALKDLLQTGGSGILQVDPANATCGSDGLEALCSVVSVR